MAVGEVRVESKGSGDDRPKSIRLALETGVEAEPRTMVEGVIWVMGTFLWIAISARSLAMWGHYFLFGRSSNWRVLVTSCRCSQTRGCGSGPQVMLD